MRGDGKLEQEVAALGDLPREELVERWIKAHDCAPPSSVRRELLVRSAAWHLQARRLGGLSSETRKRLKEAIRCLEDQIGRKARGDLEDVRSADAVSEPGAAKSERSGRKKTRQSLTPGARLLREWNGRTYVVDVIEGGFVFEARVYPSLSAIARQITGVHWSGPRFFGL